MDTEKPLLQSEPAAECQIRLSPSGREFIQLPGQTLLESGLASGLALPYNCSNGSCGECRARVLEGSVDKQRFHDFVLSESEKLQGHCLMCSSTARSDVVIEVSEAMTEEDIPLQTLQAKRCHSELMGDVTLLRLKFLRGKALRFLPGQSVRLNLPEMPAFDVPISSCPCESSMIEVHLPEPPQQLNRQIPTDPSQSVSRLTVGSKAKVTVCGPFGKSLLERHHHSPQLFLAVGIDFRVFQGLIEQLFNLEIDVPIGLLWLASDTTSHYRSNLCRSWADALDNFSYYPLNSLDELDRLTKSGSLNCFGHATAYHLPSAGAELLSQLRINGIYPDRVINVLEHSQVL